MKNGIAIGFKNYLLPVLLFGTLIGLNEIVTGSISSPYRTILVSTITIGLLSFARLRISEAGTSLLIILVAILFKLNTAGFHNCTVNILLCGPAALFILGISFEIFAGFFSSKASLSKSDPVLICVFATLMSFALFGFMNTFLLSVWNPSRLFEYVLIKGALTAVLSGGLTYASILFLNSFHQKVRLNVYVLNSILFVLITGFWMLGSYGLL